MAVAANNLNVGGKTIEFFPGQKFDDTAKWDHNATPEMIDKVMKHLDWPAFVARRDALRAQGMLAGIGVAACLEPSGGNSSFEPLLNEKNTTTTWMDSCLVRVDLSGSVTGVFGTSSSGQAHETLVATVVGEVLERDPANIRVIHADS